MVPFTFYGFCLFVCLFQSVYGLQNDIRTHSPTHTPAPEAKQPTEEELQEQVRPATESLLLKIPIEANASSQILLFFYL